jgi:hypothetical protein
VLFSTRQIENSGNVLQSANRRRQTYSAVKVPGYCGRCNNEWMSQAESRVQPLVIAMMRDERVGFSNDDLEALALWLSIKTLVADSEDHGYVTFTHSDFRWVYENRSPAERFIARVGRYEHPERTRCQFQISPITAAQALGGMKVNDPLCVEFSLVFGVVWFQCAMMRRGAHEYPLPWGSVVSPHWTALWPIVSSNVNWPPPLSFTLESLPESLRVWPEADEWLERKKVKWAETKD